MPSLSSSSPLIDLYDTIDYIKFQMVRSDGLPWHGVKQWSPFKLDALGLVTLLGAEEINQTIGTLQRRRFTEYLPLLASYVIAGDRFKDGQSGYGLYNITDGIHTTELKGWFTRWLSAQDIRNATTIFYWHIDGPRPRWNTEVQLIAPMLSFVATAPLLAFTLLMGDWYGLAGTVSIIISVVVRKIMLWQCRNALNREAAPEQEMKDLPFHRWEIEKINRVGTYARELHRQTSAPQADGIVCMFVTRADGKMVTMYAPRSILSTFVRDVPLPYPRLYKVMQWLGWVSFGVLMVALGMSSLFAQMYTCALLILSTWAMCHDTAMDTGRVRTNHDVADGSEDELVAIRFTSRLWLKQLNPAAKDSHGANRDRRMVAYARVLATEKQDATLKHWSLLPYDSEPWYEAYHKEKADFRTTRAARQAEHASMKAPEPSLLSRDSFSSAEVI